jgi:hypothetical protein
MVYRWAAWARVSPSNGLNTGESENIMALERIVDSMVQEAKNSRRTFHHPLTFFRANFFVDKKLNI